MIKNLRLIFFILLKLCFADQIVFAESITDSVLIVQLNSKAREYYRIGNDSGYLLIDSALRIAEGFGDKSLMALTLKNKGVGYYFIGKNQEALDCYEKALPFYQEVNDTLGTANCLNNIAIIYHIDGDLHKAIDYHFNALELRESVNSLSDIAGSYMGIANAFGAMGTSRKAISYNLKALKICQATNDVSKQASIFNNLGADYSILQLYDSALHFYEQALVIYEQFNYKKGMAQCYINIANNSINAPITERLSIYKKAEELGRQINYPRIEIGALDGESKILAKLGKFSEAEQSLKRAEELAIKNGFNLMLRDVYKNFHVLYDETKDYKNAYSFYRQFSSLKDSIISSENMANVYDLESKYKTAKKDFEIDLLQKDNEIQSQKVLAQHRLILFGSILFVLLVLLAFIYYRWYKSKQKFKQNELTIKNLLTEQKMLRGQMNPHFIYNSLNSIQAFISSDESYQAEKYLARFAKLMRGILENSRADFVLLDKEIEVLQLYMELEQVRFENRFQFTIELDEDLESEFLSIPPMLIQPFVENAILHGFTNRTDGKLTLKFAEQDNIVNCIIEDNGIGRAEAASYKKEKKHESLATKITEERLEMLSTQMDVKVGFEIIDKVDDKGKALGTRVEIWIPYSE